MVTQAIVILSQAFASASTTPEATSVTSVLQATSETPSLETTALANLAPVDPPDEFSWAALGRCMYWIGEMPWKIHQHCNEIWN